MSLGERMTVLVRGVAKAADFTAALDRLGIGLGQRFIVARVDHQGSPEEHGLGPFARASETSRKAAIATYPRMGSTKRAVVEYVLRRGAYGATRDEIEAGLRLTHQTTGPRVRELVQSEWLRETTDVRPTRLGQDATVLVATVKAMAEHVGGAR